MSSRWPTVSAVDDQEAKVTDADGREDDPRPGRERFYRQHLLDPGRWLRVVVNFNDDSAQVVTVVVQDDDPREAPR